MRWAICHHPATPGSRGKPGRAPAPSMTPSERAFDRLRRLVARARSLRLDVDDGLPPAPRVLERAGALVTLGATLLLLGVGLFEIGAPFAAGHYAASSAVALAGENMWHHGVLAPVARVLNGAPTNSDFYCHHPFGIFYTAAIFSALFGHHDWVARLPAVLMSTAMPWLLYRAARAAWGPVAGGVAALSYAVLPITLAYASFFALEVPTMFGIALAVLGLVRFTQAGRRRHAAFALVGLAYAAGSDWPGVVFAALALGALFFRTFPLWRFFPNTPFEPLATLWATAILVVGLVVALQMGAIFRLGQIGQLLRQGEFRMSGSEQALEEVLASRAYWIALAFTTPVIWLGKLALPLLSARVVALRSELELYALAVLGTAVFQYVTFRQAADIHFFWPQYFALYFAYAAGALVATLELLVVRFRPKGSPLVPALTALALGLSCLMIVLPDGLRALLYARKTGGRFNEKGLIIHPDVDKEAVLTKVAKELDEDASLGVDPGFKPMYWLDWVLERPVAVAPLPQPAQALRRTHHALDLRFASPESGPRLARDFQTRAFGPYLVADLRAITTPLEGFAVEPREPTLLERVFVSSSHARYVIRPSPLWGWELRHHFGLGGEPSGDVTPRSIDELRSAHNLAVRRGNGTLASTLRARLLAGVERRGSRPYSDGVTFLGARIDPGTSTFLTVYFEAAGALRDAYTFGITSQVEAPPPLSVTPADPFPREVGMPFAIPTTLWERGFIYAATTEILKRPGRERYEGWFRGKDAPVPKSGPPKVPLLVLE
jgi:hypothetical protein